MGPLVARQPQGATAREVEVEPLLDGAVRQPLVRAQGALVVLGGDVEREAGGRLVAGLAGVAQRRAGIDEAAGRVEVRGQLAPPRRRAWTSPVQAPVPRARAGGRGGRRQCRR